MQKKNIPIKHIDEFRASEREWREAYEISPCKSLFLSFEFVDLWYSCFAAPDAVRIYRAFVENKTVGFLPLILKRRCGVRFLTSITNDHWLHSEPLIINNQAQAFQQGMIAGLLADAKDWDVLCHNFSYSFSSLPGVISEQAFYSYNVSYTRKVQPTYSIFFEKPFQNYFREDLSPNTRKNFNRYRNRLLKTSEAEFVRYRNTEALANWDKFVAIEDSGWKGKAQSSIIKAPANYRLYYKRLLQFLAQNDALYLYFLNLGDRPIAGSFGYVDNMTFHWAKTGYDEVYSEFSPANLLLLYIIEDLMTNFPKIRRFHMFPWDNGYKHRYANEKSEYIETVIYSPNTYGKLVHILSHTKEKICKEHPKLVSRAKKILRYFDVGEIKDSG